MENALLNINSQLNNINADKFKKRMFRRRSKEITQILRLLLAEKEKVQANISLSHQPNL
jgi:hypothetical protein